MEQDTVDQHLVFQMIVLAPAGRPDAALAVAASRAGALGLLNLEFSDDLAAMRAAIRDVAEYGRGGFGILLDGEADGTLVALLDESPASLEVVALSGCTR